MIEHDALPAQSAGRAGAADRSNCGPSAEFAAPGEEGSAETVVRPKRTVASRGRSRGFPLLSLTTRVAYEDHGGVMRPSLRTEAPEVPLSTRSDRDRSQCCAFWWADARPLFEGVLDHAVGSLSRRMSLPSCGRGLRGIGIRNVDHGAPGGAIRLAILNGRHDS